MHCTNVRSSPRAGSVSDKGDSAMQPPPDVSHPCGKATSARGGHGPRPLLAPCERQECLRPWPLRDRGRNPGPPAGSTASCPAWARQSCRRSMPTLIHAAGGPPGNDSQCRNRSDRAQRACPGVAVVERDLDSRAVATHPLQLNPHGEPAGFRLSSWPAHGPGCRSASGSHSRAGWPLRAAGLQGSVKQRAFTDQVARERIAPHLGLRGRTRPIAAPGGC